MITQRRSTARWRVALFTLAAAASLGALGSTASATATTLPHQQRHTTHAVAVATIRHVTPTAHAGTSNPLGPFVTFLFSRTEQTAAQGCVPDVTGTAPLSTDVAPYLASLGLTATGTVVTNATKLATEYCTHSSESLASSQADLQQLSTLYGWTFVPHEYDSPGKLATLTPNQDWQVTCGQAQVLQSWGLNGFNGMIAYPGLQTNGPEVASLQANYGRNCFGWGRTYTKGKTLQQQVTTQAAATVAPYWQKTIALKGGPGTGSTAYTDPQSVISLMQSLQPGEWLTIQVYLLVDGTNAPGDPITWSCDQPGVTNTTSDVERYCESDADQVFQEAATLQDSGFITVTDPLTVAIAFGRPSTYGMPPPQQP